MEHDPDERSSNGAAPRESDRPPVGEPLVVSRHNPAARPAADGEGSRPEIGGTRIEPAIDPHRGRRDHLDGSVALVTSASGELGAALASELVDRGARVLLLDDDLGGLIETVDALAPGRTVPVRCDLGSDADVDAACEFVSRTAAIDLVLHVAADSATGGEARGDVAADGAEGGNEGGMEGGDVGAERAGLDERYRSSVRGPLALFAGLAAALAPSPRVLVVGRTPEVDADTLQRVAPSLVLEHLPRVDGMSVGSADCGSDLRVEVFAEAVVDLLVRDDLSIERATFGGAAALGR